MAIRLRGHGKLTPEQALLLACARSTLQADHARRIRLAMQRGVDWDRVWSVAREHGVGFFVARHLLPPHPPPLSFGGREARDEGDSSSTKNGKLTPSIDPAFARQVKEDLWQETAHALILREHQLRLNAELNRCGIQVLWLKGLVLSERLYGRFEARHCGDLDLLAAPGDGPKVEARLTQLGFERHRSAQPSKEFHPMAAHHSMWCARVLPDWLLIVELHHQL